MMTTYNWNRYWRPIKKDELGNNDDSPMDFFLRNIEIELTSRHSRAVPFDVIEGIPCLVLLGEPGIGKTQAVLDEEKRVRSRVANLGELVLLTDLKKYASEEELLRATFRNPVFEAWLDTGCPLHFFLDSLDECQLSIRYVAEILKREFSNLSSVENLYLRITCRTADWPASLAAILREKWGKEALQVYELAPLRLDDIREAAYTENIDVEAFFAELNRTAAIPLAIKPITLQFLIKTYKANHKLPASQVLLYEEGCLHLATEPSESRQEAGFSGDYSESQRLEAAAALAAVMIFCGIPAVRLYRNNSSSGQTQFLVSELSQFKLGNFKIEKRLIEETVRTGLFSAHDDNGSLGFAHQTYGEFLAAWFVSRHMKPEQIMSLISHPDDPEGMIVPQLYETTAWLASLSPEIFRMVLEREPDILLKSDMVDRSSQDKAALTQRVLELYDKRQQVERGRTRNFYRKLEYSDLAAQLRPYILGLTGNDFSRREAFDIAAACKVMELQEDILNVALDNSEAYFRVFALTALIQISDEAMLPRLKPFALGLTGNDHTDQLRGLALSALWPTYLSTQELFEALTPPATRNFIGEYSRFLFYNQIQHIDNSELPLALEWIERQSTRTLRVSIDLQPLFNAIFWKAWSNLDEPGVLASFAKAAWSRLHDHEPIIDERDGWDRLSEAQRDSSFEYAIRREHEKRRQVLNEVLPLVVNPNDFTFVVSSWTPLCTSDDFSWLVERYLAATSEPEQSLYSALAQWVVDPENPDHVASIADVQRTSPGFHQHLSEAITRIHQMRQTWHLTQEEKTRAQEEEQQTLTEEVTTSIAEAFTQIDNHNPNGWFGLYWAAFRQGTKLAYETELLDVKTLSIWYETSEQIQDFLVRGAELYLQYYELHTKEWLDENLSSNRTIYYHGYAGIVAFCLLLQKEAERLHNVAKSVWQKWTPIVLAYTVNSTEHEDALNELTQLCYRNAPQESIETIVRLLKADTKSAYRIRLLDCCWDQNIAQALFDLAHDEDLPRDSLTLSLRYLIANQVVGAVELAKSFIEPPFPDDRARQRGIAASNALAHNAVDSGWDTLWPALQADTEFAHEVVRAVARYAEYKTTYLGDKLNEEQLGQLYSWLTHRYPPEHHVQPLGGFAGSDSGDIERWRRAIPFLISGKRTWNAFEVLGAISKEFPDDDHLIDALNVVRESVRRTTWSPTRPDELFELVNNQRGRLIRSGEELLEAIVTELVDFQKILQGETPESRLLWNEPRTKRGEKQKCWPKDEFALSDRIKNHLDATLKPKGVVVNREVEIIRGVGGVSGARTDIHVDAKVKQRNSEEFHSLKAIIEVKGIWESKVLGRMETQLVDKYLRKTDCQYGLYVVGWFDCPQWDTSDERYKDAKSHNYNTVEDLQRSLDEEASRLSDNTLKVRAFVLDASLPH